jgi:cell wall-associated NlpC family hydrolase
MRFPSCFPVDPGGALLAAAAARRRARERRRETIAQASRPVSEKGNEVALYALGLIDTGYRFGGKNPEAGLDCSGMVSYIYGQAAGLKVQGSAADIARNGRPIGRTCCGPAIWSFFNTLNRSFSHVGIYIGDRASSMRLRATAACASTG